MKNVYYYLLTLAFFISCDDSNRLKARKAFETQASNVNPEALYVQYTTKQLEIFLDSVGHLPTQPLVNQASFWVDSIFNHQPRLHITLKSNTFEILKRAALKGYISMNVARTIFKNSEIDSICSESKSVEEQKKGLIPVVLYSFDKKKHLFNEFAIALGHPDRCENVSLYFFKGNQIISKHNGTNRYGLKLNHYKDIDGRTVVYYRRQLASGSANWWQHCFFYKYKGDQLIPILNELQNGNIANSVGNRILWLESFVLKTNPLTIKMVYNDQLPDTSKTNFGPMFIQDSTVVEYIWDAKSEKLVGRYDQSKLTKAQILSYNLEDNDLLFINSHYKALKTSLLDTAQRRFTLKYLNFVKNYSK